MAVKKLEVNRKSRRAPALVTKKTRSGRVLAKKTRAPKFRKSLQPGTIVILLSGPFQGRRAVLLKCLESGLIAVTGPYGVNGVSLRRISPRYVIATSTRITLGNMDLSKFTDEYFRRSAAEKIKERNQTRKACTKGDESIFLAQKHSSLKKKVHAHKKKDQEELDAKITPLIQKQDPLLIQYLKTKFALKFQQAPHTLKF